MKPSEDPAVAVLQSQVATLTETANRIETKLDTFNANYVTKFEFDEFKKRWFLSHTLAGVAGSVLTGVIIYAINNLGR